MQIDEFARRYRFRPFSYLSFFPFFLCVCVLFFSFCFFNELRWSNFFFVGNKFRRNNWIQSCCIPFSASTRLVVSRSGQFFFLPLLCTFSPSISIGEILKGWIFIIAPPLTPSPHRFSISIVEIDSPSRDFDIKFSFFSEFCTWPESFLFVIPEAKQNNKVTYYSLLKFLTDYTKKY